MSWKFVSSSAQPNWQMKSKHISTMSLGEKRCKIANGNKVSCTRRKREKLLNFFCLSRHRVEVIFSRAKYESAYINMAVEERRKIVTAWIAWNNGYTAVEAPLFTAQKSASLIFDYVFFLSMRILFANLALHAASAAANEVRSGKVARRGRRKR